MAASIAGAKLKAHRGSESQAKYAARLGICQSHLFRLESSDASKPSFELAARIERFTNRAVCVADWGFAPNVIEDVKLWAIESAAA